MIRELPESIGNCVEMDCIYCEKNKLNNLPEEIGQLENLKGLTLQHNLFSTVPQALLDCSALEELYFDHNRLISLPEEIGLLSNLQVSERANETCQIARSEAKSFEEQLAER